MAALCAFLPVAGGVFLGVALVVILVCWMVYDNPCNFPALFREAIHPQLTYKSRVQITGGFYAGRTGVLTERIDAVYRVLIDGNGFSEQRIAIRHLRPYVEFPALPVPKEASECEVSYPVGWEERARQKRRWRVLNIFGGKRERDRDC